MMMGAYTTPLRDYRSPRTEKYVFPRDRALCYHETICIKPYDQTI
jgi:hypothetical protein